MTSQESNTQSSQKLELHDVHTYLTCNGNPLNLLSDSTLEVVGEEVKEYRAWTYNDKTYDAVHVHNVCR